MACAHRVDLVGAEAAAEVDGGALYAAGLGVARLDGEGSVGVETAGGYCRRLILKNAPVPTEQTRTFTTAQDDQREVVVRICQGEDDVFLRNEVLGEVVLDQLPPRRRGELTIEVAFILDVDGTLSVEARDAATGRGQRTSVNLRGGLGADEIDAMRARHERLG